MRKIIALFLFGTLLLQAAQYTSFPKWYYEIRDIKEQKAAFFAILRPLVEKENLKIRRERTEVIAFFNLLHNGHFDRMRFEKIVKLAKKYRIKKIFDKEAYLKKIDTIPVSLVLAQAALESGWGKSRFARIANNIFGEWTWGKRGIIPAKREPGKKHKIKIFDSLQDSIASYMLNLNRHRAYREFRLARAMARKKGRELTGLEAAMTMQRYSEIGKRYTRLVSSIIRKNRLHRID